MTSRPGTLMTSSFFSVLLISAVLARITSAGKYVAPICCVIPPRLVLLHVGRANLVQQLRLSCVHVSQDAANGRAQVFLARSLLALLLLRQLVGRRSGGRRAGGLLALPCLWQQWVRAPASCLQLRPPPSSLFFLAAASSASFFSFSARCFCFSASFFFLSAAFCFPQLFFLFFVHIPAEPVVVLLLFLRLGLVSILYSQCRCLLLQLLYPPGLLVVVRLLLG